MLNTEMLHNQCVDNIPVGDNIPLDQLRPNPQLGRDRNVTLLVKWTNQRYHDDNLRDMFSDQWDPIAAISKRNAPRHRNQYYDGLIVDTSLDHDMLTSAQAEKVEFAIQPTAIDVTPDKIILAVGNRLQVRERGHRALATHEIKHPWFARLHAAELTPRGTIITLSSALDHIFEVDENGRAVWDMDVWATGRNVNSLGRLMLKDIPPVGKYEENPDVEKLKKPAEDDLMCVITDPESYRGLGLPTTIAPAFVNSLTQHGADQLLATSFRYGEAWVIDKNAKEITVAISGLRNPHGFVQTPKGYMVTDTGTERVLFFDHDMNPLQQLDIGVMNDRKPGLEKARWLQNTVYLGGDLYATISSPRQAITLFDLELGEYRDVAFDPDWGIQTLVARDDA